MKILKLEMKKIIMFPMLWIFFVLCLAFNVLILSDSFYESYGNYVSDIAKETGVTIDDHFYNALLQINDMNNPNYAYLLEEAGDITDVFDNYNIAYVGEAYIKAMKIEGSQPAQMLREKYSLMQERIDKKGDTNESLTLFFGGQTYNNYWYGLSRLINVLLLEGILLSSLMVLLALGYEDMNKTDLTVFSTKIGRKINSKKLLAGIIIGVGGFFILVLLTLIPYLLLNGYPHIWHSSISSGFNYISDSIAGARPFATWQSFTVLTYMLASIGVSVLLLICFMLMSYCIGLLIRNSYIGFLVLIILNGLIVLVQTCIPLTNVIHYVFYLTPVYLYLLNSYWFTDGVSIIWSYFELRGAVGSLLILSAFCLLAGRYFKSKNLT